MKEQAVNAQVMPPREFERLVANIKERGALESLPYCWQKQGAGDLEIVSGHHRVRAAKAAGLEAIHVLLDTSDFPRSKVIAKQLAHNALVGKSDAHVVHELLSRIDNPDDMLATGLPPEMLSDPQADAMLLFTPTLNMQWKTVSFLFLPHQLERLQAFLDRLEGRQDLVVAALESQWEEFLRAAAKLARIKKIRAAGTAIACLIDLAHAELEKHEHEQRDESAA